jgi:hypothetical protein
MNLRIQARNARCSQHLWDIIHVAELRALLDDTMKTTAFVP